MKMTTYKTYQHLQGKDFLTLMDITSNDLLLLLELAHDLKKQKQSGKMATPLKGKTLAMIFDKPSTRTRISFEVGIIQLGGAALHLQRDDLQLGRGESVEDTAHVLSRYVDGILIRTFSHELVESLAQFATIPVINGLTDLVHPCQILADLMTIQEEKGELAGLKLTYLGDGNNVVHSLMHGAAMTGIDLTICTPKGYEPSAQIWEEIRELSAQTGAKIQLVHDPYIAVQGADVLYTDVWASMGQEVEKQKRQKDFEGYQVTPTLMALAKEDAIFMHCLPAYRGLEVAAEVIDGPQSVVFQQAENRLHAQKALMLALLGDINKEGLNEL